MKKFWGFGYATEAAKACLEFGFNQLGMKTIVGRVVPENGASIRVLEKIGLTYLEKRMDDGIEESIYFKRKVY